MCGLCLLCGWYWGLNICSFANFSQYINFTVLCAWLDATIKFERNEYRAAESSLVRPRLALSKTPTTTFTVNIAEDDEEGGCCSNARGQ